MDVIHATTLEDEPHAGRPNQGAVGQQNNLTGRKCQIGRHLVGEIPSMARVVCLWDDHAKTRGVGVDRKECEMSFILPNDMCRGTRPFGIQPMRGFVTERVSVWSKQPAKEVFRSSKVMPSCEMERQKPTAAGQTASLLWIAKRIHTQKTQGSGKVYSVHKAKVECIAKSKAGRKYASGNKVSLAVTSKGG